MREGWSENLRLGLRLFVWLELFELFELFCWTW